MTLAIAQQQNGLKRLQIPLGSGAQTMVIRGATYYAFSSYRDFSVFSCESHLSWRLYFSQRNSAELWRLLESKIRISICLDTDLFSPNLDSLHPMIGATLSLMRNSNREQFCDYCKMRYAHLSRNNELHPLARVPAYWKAVSNKPGRAGITRFYCLQCAADLQNWSDGSFFSLKEQLEFEINRAKQEYLDDKLA